MSISEQLSKKYQADSYNEATTERSFSKEKAAATAKGEPWVAVLDTQVNPDNIKHGFFELDWNDQFIELLLDDGFIGGTPEELVEKWFHTIISEMLKESGYEGNVNAGNVVEFLKTND